MRMRVYAGTSALVAAGALLKAFHQRPNFYSATVYLSQSNACILILTNLALVCACSFIYTLQRIFYGPLRQIEIEQLTEKAWYAVLDTLLAMPTLSHDLSGWMLAIFVLLLAGKVWGWIGEGRVDILEQQPPQNPRLFHARLSSSLILSVLFDGLMMHYCINSVRDDPRPGMMVIFMFEFAILTTFSLFTLSRYILALIEADILKTQTKQKIAERKVEIRAERARLEQEHAQAASGDDSAQSAPLNLPSEDDIDENEIDVPGWEEKRRWLFGLELATDFIKLVIYAVFFAISLTFMGLPMHIMRDVYLTFSAFIKRLQDYSNYRKATQNMNDRYSDATVEELSNNDTCIVCRETMTPYGAASNASRPNESLRAKKLPCGHILHLRCLKAWLERQQTCPTCRRPVVGGQSPNGIAPGQARIEGANLGAAAGGDPNAAGNNAAVAPGQQQQRPNRLRMLNLGPIRIGLYNGPAHQLPNALEQNRSPHARQAGTGGALGNQSTQVQLMQVEERLVHEARQLAIEQTQLGTVRALEAELARLRALHDTPRQAVATSEAAAPEGTSQGVPIQPSQIPTPAASQMPMPQIQFPTHMPQPVPFAPTQFPQAFQPAPGQEPFGSGHASLPQGMTLPEGWTITPLHPVGGPLRHPSSTLNPAAPAATASRSTTPVAHSGPRAEPPSATTDSTTVSAFGTAPAPSPPATASAASASANGLPDMSAQIESALAAALRPQIAALRPQIENAILQARRRAAAAAAAANGSSSPAANGASAAVQASSIEGAAEGTAGTTDATQTVASPVQSTIATNGNGAHAAASQTISSSSAMPPSATAGESSWGFEGVDDGSDSSGTYESSSSEEGTEKYESLLSGETATSRERASTVEGDSVEGGSERGRGKRRVVSLEDVEDEGA